MRHIISLIVLSLLFSGFIAAQQVEELPVLQPSGHMRHVGIGVFFDPAVLQHPEITALIERLSGRELNNTVVFYRMAAGFVLDDTSLVVPATFSLLPQEAYRQRYVRLAEYVFSLFPTAVLSVAQEESLKTDLMRIVRARQSSCYLMDAANAPALSIRYQDDAFSVFSFSDGGLLPLVNGYPEFHDLPAPGTTVYLSLSGTGSSVIRYTAAEVLSSSDDHFSARVDVGEILPGTSVTDIRGRKFGLVQSIDLLSRTVRVVSLRPLFSRLAEAGVDVRGFQAVAGGDLEEIESFEVGNTFFIVTAERMRVFLDGRYYGMTPLLVRDIVPGEYDLELDSELFRYSGRVVIKPERSGVVTIRPGIWPRETE